MSAPVASDAGQPEHAARSSKIVSAARAIASTPSASSSAWTSSIGPRIDLAFAAVPRLVVGLDDAVGRPAEPRIELGHGDDQRRIERREEQARRRALLGAVDVVEHAVAEYAVMVEVVGDAQIEGLVEVAQPFLRPRQDGRRQGGEDQDPECDPAADVAQAVHRFGPWHAIATGEIGLRQSRRDCRTASYRTHFGT